MLSRLLNCVFQHGLGVKGVNDSSSSKWIRFHEMGEIYCSCSQLKHGQGKKKLSPHDDLWKTPPSNEQFSFWTEKPFLLFPFITLPCFCYERSVWKYWDFSIEEGYKKEGTIIEMAKEAHYALVCRSTISGVSSLKLSQMVITRRVRGEIHLKPAISCLREYD